MQKKTSHKFRFAGKHQMGARKRPLEKSRAGRLLHILLSPLFIHACSTLQQRKRAKTNTFPVRKNRGKLLPVMHTPPSLIVRRKKNLAALASHMCKNPSWLLYFSSSQKIKGRKALQYFWGPPSTQCFPPFYFSARN